MLYAILAMVAGVVAVVFTRSLYFVEDLFVRVPIPDYGKAILGGALIGALGLAYPQILGVGYDTITAVLQNEVGIVLVLSLIGAKLIGTTITLAAGGSGGVFAPALFSGSLVGGAFGVLVNYFWPGSVAQPGAYALVTGTTHAPLTAMLILFELTDD